jgi:hypothetical protein
MANAFPECASDDPVSAGNKGLGFVGQSNLLRWKFMESSSIILQEAFKLSYTKRQEEKLRNHEKEKKK